MSSNKKSSFMKTLKTSYESTKDDGENWSISDDDSDIDNLTPSFLKKSNDFNSRMSDQNLPKPAPRKSLTNERLPWEKSDRSLSPKSDKSSKSSHLNSIKHHSRKNSDDSLDLNHSNGSNFKSKTEIKSRKSIGNNHGGREQSTFKSKSSNEDEELRRSINKSPQIRITSPDQDIFKKDSVDGRKSSFRNDLIYGSDDEYPKVQARKRSSVEKLKSGKSTPDSELLKKSGTKYNDGYDNDNNSRGSSRRSSIAENQVVRKSSDGKVASLRDKPSDNKSAKNYNKKHSLLRDSSDEDDKGHSHKKDSVKSNKHSKESDEDRIRIRKKSESSIAKIQVNTDDSSDEYNKSKSNVAPRRTKDSTSVSKDDGTKYSKNDAKLTDTQKKNSIQSDDRIGTQRKNSLGSHKKYDSNDSDESFDGRNKKSKENRENKSNDRRRNSLSKGKHRSSDEDHKMDKKNLTKNQFNKKLKEDMLADKKDEDLFRKIMEDFERADNKSKKDKRSDEEDEDDDTSLCDAVLHDKTKTSINQELTTQIKDRKNERSSKKKVDGAIEQLTFNQNNKKKNISNQKLNSFRQISSAKRLGSSHDVSSANFESSSDIRRVVFNEWLGIVDQRMRSAKKERELMEKQLEEKKKKEKEEKLVEAKSSYEAWISTKKGDLTTKKTQQQKLEDKKRKDDKEQLQKKKDAENTFKDWKDKIDKELMRRHRKKKKVPTATLR